MSPSFFNGMDAKTFQMFMKLQQEDVQELHAGNNGKEMTETSPDSKVAIRLYESELKSLSTYFSAHTAARRHDQRRATESARDKTSVRQESAAGSGSSNKRKYAEDLEVRPSIERPNNPSQHLHNGPLPPNVRDTKIIIDLTTRASSSPVAASGSGHHLEVVELDDEEHTCVACLSSHAGDNTFHAPCEHSYCHPCLRELFKASLTSDFQFPPQCCGQLIPTDMDQTIFSAELITRIKDKEIELSDPSRIYCRRLTCSAFISKGSVVGDIATCPSCQTTTCIVCKGAEHADHACKEDAATQAVLKLAAKYQWRRCPSCHALVQRSGGCRHMICRCRTQFCYKCGVIWTGSHNC